MHVSAVTVRGSSSFSLDSASFAQMRLGRDAFIDKTGAIADLLMSEEGMLSQRRAFFARPRKFGKSLTLDIAASMLAAGKLSKKNTWPGYKPVNVSALFKGLDVHNRFLRGDKSLGTLLREPHFVITLDLGEAQTGTELRGALFASIASIASTAFDPALEAKVLAQPTVGHALRALVNAVPYQVPVAVLVDVYDAAIISDVSKQRWDAAYTGIEALRSLMMVSKSHDVGPRIKRFIVTGIARFARTTLFSGANNFSDFTSSPLLSRVMGFSQEEILTTFPEELARLGDAEGTEVDGAKVDGAIRKLARWYDGYCFDGVSSTFNPYAVLLTLRKGRISETELDGVSGTNWLDFTSSPLQVPTDSSLTIDASNVHRIDIADLEAQRVKPIPLLLQTGVLSRVPSVTGTDFMGMRTDLLCQLPNEYARRSLAQMVERSLGLPVPTAFIKALHTRDRAAFTTAAIRLFESSPNLATKRGKPEEKVNIRESNFQFQLYAAIAVCLSVGDIVDIELPSQRGRADILVRFRALEKGGVNTVWILELGVDDDEDEKLKQAQEYSHIFAEDVTVFCCAIIVSSPKFASKITGENIFSFSWSRRKSGGAEPEWEKCA